MKQLLILITILILITGCTAPDMTPEPECLIIHEGGHYVVEYNEWQDCGCPGCETYPAGTYWVNYDDTMFLIGDPVPNPIKIYGECPDDCILIIKPDDS